MVHLYGVPPGLAESDGSETATVSRERRRVSLAARVAAQELQQHCLTQHIARLEEKLNEVLHVVRMQGGPPADTLSVLCHKVFRLEALMVCSPNPSVDCVLDKLLTSPCSLENAQPEVELSPSQISSPMAASKTIVCIPLKFDIFEEKCNAYVQADLPITSLECLPAASLYASFEQVADPVDGQHQEEDYGGEGFDILPDWESLLYMDRLPKTSSFHWAPKARWEQISSSANMRKVDERVLSSLAKPLTMDILLQFGGD